MPPFGGGVEKKKTWGNKKKQKKSYQRLHQGQDQGQHQGQGQGQDQAPDQGQGQGQGQGMVSKINIAVILQGAGGTREGWVEN